MDHLSFYWCAADPVLYSDPDTRVQSPIAARRATRLDRSPHVRDHVRYGSVGVPTVGPADKSAPNRRLRSTRGARLQLTTVPLVEAPQRFTDSTHTMEYVHFIFDCDSCLLSDWRHSHWLGICPRMDARGRAVNRNARFVRGWFRERGAGNQLSNAQGTGPTAQVGYNALGQPTSSASPGAAAGVLTSYGYDAATHNLTTITPVTGAGLGSRAFTHDSFGRLATATATDGRGRGNTITYDKRRVGYFLDAVVGVAVGVTGGGGMRSKCGLRCRSSSCGRGNCLWVGSI